MLYNKETTETLFTKIKDQASSNEQKDMIYEIKCINCDKVYVGETKQGISLDESARTKSNTELGQGQTRSIMRRVHKLDVTVWIKSI